MSRCQHCKKLTHSEDLIVEFDAKDLEKVRELREMETWFSPYQYANEDTKKEEIGKLKCGDIWIHFLVRNSGINE